MELLKKIFQIDNLCIQKIKHSYVQVTYENNKNLNIDINKLINSMDDKIKELVLVNQDLFDSNIIHLTLKEKLFKEIKK